MALTEINSLGIKDLEVKTADIANDAITNDKIATGAVTSDSIGAAAVTGNGLQDLSVGSTKIANDAVTLAKMAGGTDGQIITYDASGDPIAVGPGTDGQVLTSTGAGSPPAFEDAAAGVGGASGVDFNDTVKARFGTGNDLAIYHNGTDAIIDAEDAGATRTLILKGGTTSDRWIELQSSDGEPHVRCAANSYVKLYHDNSVRLETTSSGVKIGSSTSHADADNLVIGSAESTPIGLSLQSANDGYGCINWGDASDNDVARISYNHNGDLMQITTNGAEAMRITSLQDFMLKTTSARDSAAVTIWENKTVVALECATAGDWGALPIKHQRADGTTQGHILIAQNSGGTAVGGIKADGDETFFNTSSDYRLKENLVAVADGITRLKQLKPYKYNFKATPSATKEGFLAHEVAPLIPEAVSGTKDEVATEDDGVKKKGEPVYQTLDYSKLTPLLTAALQEAITKIETLETKVAALETKVAALEAG